MRTINALISVENIMGVYRNYSSLRKRNKYLVTLYICFIACITLFPSTYILYSYALALNGYLTPNRLFTVSYISFQVVNSLFAFIWAPFSSHHFEEFILSISDVQKLYDIELNSKTYIRKRNKKFYCEAVLFCIAMLSITPMFAYDSFVKGVSFIAIISFFTKLNVHYRFFYVNFVFLEFIDYLIVPLNFFNESVSIAVKNLNGEDIEIDIKEQVWILRRKIEHWDEISKSLLTATDSFCGCFGLQVRHVKYNIIILCVSFH